MRGLTWQPHLDVVRLARRRGVGNSTASAAPATGQSQPEERLRIGHVVRRVHPRLDVEQVLRHAEVRSQVGGHRRAGAGESVGNTPS